MGTNWHELKAKSDAAWSDLMQQLDGAEPSMDRANAVGEWTVRQVLAHLLFEPGWSMVDYFRKFSEHEPPPTEIIPGVSTMTDARRTMNLRDFVDALDTQRQEVFAYVGGLPEADLERRKSRVPFLKPLAGTDEISIAIMIRALFVGHWHDHAGQLAKIRTAVGLRDVR